MKIQAFKDAIKEANEQFNVIQTDGVTEVHWIYAGFDLYEEVKRHPQYKADDSNKTRVRGLFGTKETIEEDRQPQFHVIAKISEEREHVLELQLDASQMPERMRRLVLPIITDYTSTPIDERVEIDIPTPEPKVASAGELRKQHREKKQRNEKDVKELTPIEYKEILEESDN